MSQNRIPHVLRGALGSDHNFIRSSWLKSYAISNFRKYMIPQVYYSEHAEVVNQVLTNAEVLLAVDPEDFNHIYAYVVFELCGDIVIIHYAYTKELYRKLGFCSKLVTEIKEASPKKVLIATHANEHFPHLEKKFNLVYNPYQLFRRHRV